MYQTESTEPGRTEKLSILMAVYNEQYFVEQTIDKVLAAPLPSGMERELIIVDDCSTDGTPAILERIAREHPETISLYTHETNRGKGAAIRTTIQYATGDICIIQDADLEYDPKDYPVLLDTIQRDRSIQVVFGSRFLGNIEGMRLGNYLANRFLSWATNVLYRSDITDLCTGFKLYKTELIRDIPLVRDGFDLEHELTAKLLKKGFRIIEVPIDYKGRDIAAGKKVRWTDFFIDMYTLLRFRL